MNGNVGNFRVLFLSVALFSLTILIGLPVICDRESPDVQTEIGTDGSVDGGILCSDDIRQSLPPDWAVGPSMQQEKGWQQTGFVRMGLEDTYSAVSGLMLQKGYALNMREPREDSALAMESTRHLLAEYRDPTGKGKVMWALWRERNNRTGFSWGIPK